MIRIMKRLALSRDGADTGILDKGFLKALLAEDEVGCVIRSHLYVEAQIDRYLSLATEVLAT